MDPVLNLTSFPKLIVLFGFGLVGFFSIPQKNVCICGFILEVGELSKDLNMTDLQNG